MTRPSRRLFLRRSAAAAGLGATAAVAGPKAVDALLAADNPAPMKYSICNETFRGWPQAKIFRLAADCGYQGVEIAPFTISNDVRNVSAKQRARLRKQADKAGVQIVGLHWLLAKTQGLHLTSPDRQVRRRTAHYLGELANFCADLGGQVMIFGSPQQRNLAEGVRRADGLNYATEVLRRAMPVLAHRNVMLGLEPLAPNETNFLRTAAEAVELAKRVDAPHCKIILDCKAMFTEPTPIPELIRKYGSWMVHFHANDPNLQGPGFGKLDFVPIFKALRDIDYRGWVSVEVFDYSPGPERLARESIRYMRRCLAKVDRLDKPGKQGAG